MRGCFITHVCVHVHTYVEYGTHKVCMYMSKQVCTTGASQVALVVKNPPANAGGMRDVGLIPESGRFLEGGHENLLQYSCLEFLPLSHGQRNLGGYSPWGHTDLDTTKVT